MTTTSLQCSARDKADNLAFTINRARLLLKGADMIIENQIGNMGTGMPTEAVEIVWELTQIALSAIEEVADVTSQIVSEISGPTVNRGFEAALDPSRSATVGAH